MKNTLVSEWVCHTCPNERLNRRIPWNRNNYQASRILLVLMLWEAFTFAATLFSILANHYWKKCCCWLLNGVQSSWNSEGSEGLVIQTIYPSFKKIWHCLVAVAGWNLEGLGAWNSQRTFAIMVISSGENKSQICQTLMLWEVFTFAATLVRICCYSFLDLG